MRRQLANCLWPACLLSAIGVYAQGQEKDPKAQAIKPAEVNLGRPVDFERDVYPILDAKCFACHNVAINENGLNLEDVKSILKGGKRGPSVIAKDPDKSLLIKAVKYDDPDLQMPKRGKLSDQQIADLVAWVKMGAPWPDDGGKTNVAKTFDLKERAKHWSLQPIRKPPLPGVGNGAWCRSPTAGMQRWGSTPATPPSTRSSAPVAMPPARRGRRRSCCAMVQATTIACTRTSTASIFFHSRSRSSSPSLDTTSPAASSC